MTNIIIKDGIAYNRWSKSKYRDIYPSDVTWDQKKSQTNKVLPKHLKYLTAGFLTQKNTYTYRERVNYMLLINKYVKVYNYKCKVLEQLINFKKQTTYTCKIKGKVFNFKKVDNGNNNGWINLMCIERNKVIRARMCNDNTVYLFKSKIDTNFFVKNDNIIYLTPYLI